MKLKKAFLILIVFTFYSAIGQNNLNNETFTLKEVDVAPVFKKGIKIDSLSSHQNFVKNLRKHIINNLEILESHKSKIEKVYVQFIIKKDGSIAVLNIRGKSWLAMRYASNVILKIKNLNPAIKNGKKVNVKYTIPIKFRTFVVTPKRFDK